MNACNFGSQLLTMSKCNFDHGAQSEVLVKKNRTEWYGYFKNANFKK
jgi:hypothetical protein